MKNILILTVFAVSFLCSCGGDFPNERNGDYWSDKAPDRMSHADAISYCDGLGGHLPTISELRTLIQNCSKRETGGSCGVTDSCLSASCWNSDCSGDFGFDTSGGLNVFGDTGDFWSSSVKSDETGKAWGVNFYDCCLGPSYRHNSYNVRCVE